MAPRPLSWVRDYDADFDLTPLHTPSTGRNSPTERHHMLADMPSSSMRDFPPIASSSSRPSISHSRTASASIPSPNEYKSDPSGSRTAASELEAGPSFLKMPRSASFTSSPLNPAFPSGPPSSHILSPFARPGSRGSAHITRIPSEESRALTSLPFSMNGSGLRGSMVLYRRADSMDETLLPPKPPMHRNSMTSISGDSFVSISSDSKYPAGMMTPERGLVAYAYDPSMDEREPLDEEDALHNPDEKLVKLSGRSMSFRGFKNLAALVVLIGALLGLFIVYPVFLFSHNSGRDARIVGNTRINSSGQAFAADLDPRSQFPLHNLYEMIDPVTPENVKSRTSTLGEEYDLVFSDEFETEGRTFYEGDDEVWEAVDDELYNPQQVTTRDGHLVIRLDAIHSDGDGSSTLAAGVLRRRSPFCMGGGFIEIRAVLPEKQNHTLVFWSGAWTTVESDATNIPGERTDLTQTLLLKLDIGIAANNTSHATVPREPVMMLIDYVRFYQRAGQPPPSCDNARHHRLSFFPDLL